MFGTVSEPVGELVGAILAGLVGKLVAAFVGEFLGAFVGKYVGALVGKLVGDLVRWLELLLARCILLKSTDPKDPSKLMQQQINTLLMENNYGKIKKRTNFERAKT